jgi:guanosine-3',5'-bis(diphosphate) 3'-pyrophosphohydrolase
MTRPCLTAALLHDTIEDTTTDFDDLAERFGPEIAGWVAVLSKDKRRADPDREAAYLTALAGAPAPVQIAKLADILDNLMDSSGLPPDKRARSVARARAYLRALAPDLTPDARGPMATVLEHLSRLE